MISVKSVIAGALWLRDVSFTVSRDYGGKTVAPVQTFITIIRECVEVLSLMQYTFSFFLSPGMCLLVLPEPMR